MRHFAPLTQSLYALLLPLAIACSPSVLKDPKDYLKYLAEPENGLVKEKTLSGLLLRVKYLPGDYLAYTALNRRQGLPASIKDSVKKTFDHSVTFLLTIGPAAQEDFDITRLGVENYAQFSERIESFSFHAQEWMRLLQNGKEQAPAIAKMENINAVERSRNFIVVFDSEKNTARDVRMSDMCFVYNDELFSTGTTKFIFKTEDILRIPEFQF